jgi:hypothetical protein
MDTASLVRSFHTRCVENTIHFALVSVRERCFFYYAPEERIFLFFYSVVVDSLGAIRAQFTRTLNIVVNCELGRGLVRTAGCLLSLSLRLSATHCDNDRTFEIQDFNAAFSRI